MRVLLITSDDFYSKIVIGFLLSKSKGIDFVVARLETSFSLKAKLFVKGVFKSPLYIAYLLYECFMIFHFKDKVYQCVDHFEYKHDIVLRDINSDKSIDAVRGVRPDCVLFVRPLQIISNKFLNFFPNSYNLHNTQLPKYRGLGGIFQALRHNENELGITVFRVSSHLDAGDILVQRFIPLDRPYSLFEATIVSYLYAKEVVLEFCSVIKDGELEFMKQCCSCAKTYSWPKLRDIFDLMRTRYTMFGARHMEYILREERG